MADVCRQGSEGALWAIYLVVFMDVTNFCIVFPLLPSVALNFNVGAALLGGMVGSVSIAQLICTSFLGQVSEHLGWCQVLLIALLGSTVSSILVGIARTFPMLLLARMIHGAAGASAAVASAFIADATVMAARPKKVAFMSYICAATSASLMIGPALGGALAHFGFAVACIISGVVASLNFIAGCIFSFQPRAGDFSDALANGDGTTVEQSASANGYPSPWSTYLVFYANFFHFLGFAVSESVVGHLMGLLWIVIFVRVAFCSCLSTLVQQRVDVVTTSVVQRCTMSLQRYLMLSKHCN